MTRTRQTRTSRKAAKTVRRIPRRVTPTCQGQDALDLTGTGAPEPIPAQVAGEPVKTNRSRDGRSQRAKDWAETTIGSPWDRNGGLAPCVLCGTPALMTNPYTNQPCHLTCAMQQAAERGEPW